MPTTLVVLFVALTAVIAMAALAIQLVLLGIQKVLCELVRVVSQTKNEEERQT